MQLRHLMFPLAIASVVIPYSTFIEEEAEAPAYTRSQTSRNLSDAEGIAWKELQAAEKRYGAQHPEVARQIGTVAMLQEMDGQYEQARQLHLQALDIEKATYGENHPVVASRLNNLAILMKKLGDEPGASAYFAKADTIWKESKGR